MIIYKRKAAFVANELSALLRIINRDIEKATYYIVEDIEFVTVHYTDSWERNVNVTGDSLGTLTVDVLTKIGAYA